MLLTPETKTILGVLALFYVILAGIGLLCYLKPAKKINGLFGYRTTRSMENQANWDYAQHLYPRYILIAAHAQLITSLLLFFLLPDRVGLDTQMFMHIVLFIIALLIVIPLVERKLARFEKMQQSS